MSTLSVKAVGNGTPLSGPLRWISKGFWAVSDQAMFAASNFVLNVLLARAMSPNDYGSFTVAFTIFLLFGSFHISLFIEPMLVLGASRYRDDLPRYLVTLSCAQALLALPACGLFGLIALCCWRWGSPTLTWAVVGFGLAHPLLLFLWLMRRASYIRSQPDRAALAGLGYLLLMMLGLGILSSAGWLTIGTTLILLAASSAAAALWLAARMGMFQTGLPDKTLLGEVVAEHWRYGRWLVAMGLAYVIPQNIVYLALPVWHGVAEAGTMRATMNLVMPVFQANAAICMLLMPTLVRERNTPAFAGYVRRFLVLMTAGPVCYWLLLGVFCTPLVRLLYGEHHLAQAYLLWGIGFLPVLQIVMDVLGRSLIARERPDLAFHGAVASAACALTVGMALIAFGGVYGAIASQVLNNACALAVLVYHVRRDRRHHQKKLKEGDWSAAELAAAGNQELA